IKKGEKQPERPRKRIADEKRMFTVCFSGGGIQFVHFLPKGTTMDSKVFTSEVIKPLQQKYIKEYHAKRGEYYLHFDNAPIHKSQYTQTYINAGIFSVLKHPPYSPDISPCDYYLFGLLKQELKGIMMNSEEQMKTEVGKILNEIHSIEIQRALRSWSRRLEYIIQHDGAYYNKDKW
ncbi:MAG: putative mariner mos1 transposase, partial [Streblomastix strix]